MQNRIYNLEKRNNIQFKNQNIYQFKQKFFNKLFYAKNYLQHTSLHEVCIPLDHFSTSLQILVISIQVFHGGEIFIIVPQVYQVQDITHLGMDVLRKKMAKKHCHMPAIFSFFLFSYYLCFPLHLNIIFSRIFLAFEY